MLRLMDISNRKKASVKGKTHAKSSACISTVSPCERPGAGFASTCSTILGTALMSMDVGSVAGSESVRVAATVAEVVPELHRYSDFEELLKCGIGALIDTYSL